MNSAPKKKLMPKSALLVRKYQKPIRAIFISFIVILCVTFVLHTPSQPRAHELGKLVQTSQKLDTRHLVLPATDKIQDVHYPVNDETKESAAMVTLARNRDLWSLAKSVRHVEDRFNRRYHYDWVFLNDEPFSEEFQRVMTALVSGTAKFGLIPKDHWNVPDWIDEKKAAAAREKMVEFQIPYADSVSYRNMCRYESGFFWRHPLLDSYSWYWRVEPDIELFCDINYDVFKFMRENKKKYGFILSISEYVETIPTLWNSVKEFMAKNPKHIHKNNLMNFISDDKGETYNLCHFWSNFEIASLDFWRSQAYRDFFDHLDKTGGFYYERWGDAPVHSIAAALMLDESELHFFDGIGYYHPAYFSCPVEEKIRLQNQCVCDPATDQTWMNGYFCTRKFFEARKLALPKEVEAR
ncbi:LAMI_0E06788g1_1 [Lachancea mirantina]|uniref:LAMI_0E06788g1_1 n=1 Tax=Lachancea mirantina TaxID=1230905 RepID=A0A1G4JMP5_9SACH|nr:LAMI_0E06788g1_1 [Lachancea mirantina]